MTPVEFKFVTPDGVVLDNTAVEIQLSDAGYNDIAPGIALPSPVTATTDINGEVTVELWSNPHPYHVTVNDPSSDGALHYLFIVPGQEYPGQTFRLQDIVIEGEMSETPYDEAALLAIQSTKASVFSAAMAAASSASAAASSALTAANYGGSGSGGGGGTPTDTSMFLDKTVGGTITGPLVASAFGSPGTNLGNSGTGKTVNWTNRVARLVLTDDCELEFSDPTVSYPSLILKLTQNNVGGHIITWPINIKWAGGSPPLLGTDPGSITIISFWHDNDATYFGSGSMFA